MITDKTLYIKQGHVSGDEWDDTRPATDAEIMEAAENVSKQRLSVAPINTFGVMLNTHEQRIVALEEWRNRTIWGFQAQSLDDKPIEAMTIWELISWAAQSTNPHTGSAMDIRFRQQAVFEINRRLEEARRGR